MQLSMKERKENLSIRRIGLCWEATRAPQWTRIPQAWAGSPAQAGLLRARHQSEKSIVKLTSTKARIVSYASSAKETFTLNQYTLALLRFQAGSPKDLPILNCPIEQRKANNKQAKDRHKNLGFTKYVAASKATHSQKKQCANDEQHSLSKWCHYSEQLIQHCINVPTPHPTPAAASIPPPQTTVAPAPIATVATVELPVASPKLYPPTQYAGR